VNLNYLDPDELDVDRAAAEWSDDSLVVPRAGELLYRVGRPPAM
jgi:hypothetical protein